MKDTNGNTMMKLSTFIFLIIAITGAYTGIFAWSWTNFQSSPPAAYYETFRTKKEADETNQQILQQLREIKQDIKDLRNEIRAKQDKN